MYMPKVHVTCFGMQLKQEYSRYRSLKDQADDYRIMLCKPKVAGMDDAGDWHRRRAVAFMSQDPGKRIS